MTLSWDTGRKGCELGGERFFPCEHGTDRGDVPKLPEGRFPADGLAQSLHTSLAASGEDLADTMLRQHESRTAPSRECGVIGRARRGIVSQVEVRVAERLVQHHTSPIDCSGA